MRRKEDTEWLYLKVTTTSEQGCQFRIKVAFKNVPQQQAPLTDRARKPETAPAQSVEDFDFKRFSLGKGSKEEKTDYLHEITRLIVEDRTHLKVCRQQIREIKARRQRKVTSVESSVDSAEIASTNDFLQNNVMSQGSIDNKRQWQ